MTTELLAIADRYNAREVAPKNETPSNEVDWVKSLHPMLAMMLSCNNLHMSPLPPHDIQGEGAGGLPGGGGLSVYQGEGAGGLPGGGGWWSTRGRGAQREGFFGIGVGGCWSGGLISHRISNQASGFQEGFGNA